MPGQGVGRTNSTSLSLRIAADQTLAFHWCRTSETSTRTGEVYSASEQGASWQFRSIWGGSMGVAFLAGVSRVCSLWKLWREAGCTAGGVMEYHLRYVARVA